MKDATDPLPVKDIQRDLENRWPDVVCKFPAVKQGLLDRDNPLSSYVFVQTPLSPKIEKSIFVSGLLRDPVTRKLQKVTDAELAVMAPSTPMPEPGTTVRVTCGDFTGLEGTTVEKNCSSIRVLIELWSNKRLLTLDQSEFVVV